jgi:hypothetical protein
MRPRAQFRNISTLRADVRIGSKLTHWRLADATEVEILNQTRHFVAAAWMISAQNGHTFSPPCNRLPSFRREDRRVGRVLDIICLPAARDVHGRAPSRDTASDDAVAGVSYEQVDQFRLMRAVNAHRHADRVPLGVDVDLQFAWVESPYRTWVAVHLCLQSGKLALEM